MLGFWESVINATQIFFRAGQSTAAGINGLDEVGFLPAIGTVPFHHRIGGPADRLVLVALIAGVRRAVGLRQVRPRHAQAMIASHIDDHVGVGWHVTVDAERAGAIGLVMVMLFGAELCQRVTLAAHRVQVV